jgi:hypothetical protein
LRLARITRRECASFSLRSRTNFKITEEPAGANKRKLNIASEIIFLKIFFNFHFQVVFLSSLLDFFDGLPDRLAEECVRSERELPHLPG